MISVVLSGGSGSRLWPVSREAYPKQFCEFFDRSFLRETIDRLKEFGPIDIVTLDTMATLTKGAVIGTNITDDHILLEPLPKNTAPAIALAVHLAIQRGQSDEVMGVFPADHLITEVSLFEEAVLKAASLVQKQDFVVTFGVTPRYPATGYGYLEVEPTPEAGSTTQLAVHKARGFSEKPTAEKAEEYLYAQNFFWNAGIFFFKIKVIAQHFQTYMPELWKKISTIKPDLSNLKLVYSNISAESFDYGIMERLKGQIVCISGDYGWSDVGSWDELARLQEEQVKIDSHANVFSYGATDNFVYSNQEKVVGLCGVDQLIVVDTPDALLVTKRGESQNVKKLVESMREAHLPQANEHIFEIRPWGRFEVLSDRSDHKVKRLIVEPGQQLSYQRHEKRSEHWSIVKGKADVILDGELKHFTVGQQLFVPQGCKHRLINPGQVPLVVIEVQTGSYFGEDDIERFVDDYKRI